VGLYWVPGHAVLRGNEIVNKLARGLSALRFVGPEPAFGDFRQDMRRRIRRWLVDGIGYGGEGLTIHRDRIED
jgi:hypothetical protein